MVPELNVSEPTFKELINGVSNTDFYLIMSLATLMIMAWVYFTSLTQLSRMSSESPLLPKRCNKSNQELNLPAEIVEKLFAWKKFSLNSIEISKENHNIFNIDPPKIDMIDLRTIKIKTIVSTLQAILIWFSWPFFYFQEGSRKYSKKRLSITEVHQRHSCLYSYQVKLATTCKNVSWRSNL